MKRVWVAGVCLWAIALCISLPVDAAAQTSNTVGDVQLFRPAADSTGTHNLQLGAPGMPFAARAGLYLVAANKLLSAEVDDSNSPLGGVVTRRIDLVFVGSVSLARRLEVGVVAPYVISQDGLETNLVQGLVGKDSLAGGGMGDIVLVPKVSLVRQGSVRPALALGAELTLPTGDAENLFGESGPVYAPFVALSRQIGPHQGTLNLGYRIRRDANTLVGARIDDELFYRMGVALAVDSRKRSPRWFAIGSLFGHSPIEEPFGIGASSEDRIRTALEANAAIQRRIATNSGGLHLTGGLGVGLSSGIGSPRMRLVLGVDYVTIEPFDDDDNDRFPNSSDQCPMQPEDYDDFEDQDGCPEIDNDQDGVEDMDDGCPEEREDIDGFEDYDGCPEVSDEDDDLDGVSNRDDRCPKQTEDLDNFKDDDGCPDLDNDGDGLSDLNDLCPLDFEDQATSTDKDGCPGSTTVAVEEAQVYARRIITRELVRFRGKKQMFTRSSIQPLDTVARYLRHHPELGLVEIQVSAENRRRPAKRLAELRAERLRRYLVSRGVLPERLKAVAARSRGGAIGVVFRIRKLDKHKTTQRRR